MHFRPDDADDALAADRVNDAARRNDTRRPGRVCQDAWKHLPRAFPQEHWTHRCNLHGPARDPSLRDGSQSSRCEWVCDTPLESFASPYSGKTVPSLTATLERARTGAYIVENVRSDGVTEWLAEFSRDELEIG
jgi:hypothetical protein